MATLKVELGHMNISCTLASQLPAGPAVDAPNIDKWMTKADGAGLGTFSLWPTKFTKRSTLEKS